MIFFLPFIAVAHESFLPKSECLINADPEDFFKGEANVKQRLQFLQCIDNAPILLPYTMTKNYVQQKQNLSNQMFT